MDINDKLEDRILVVFYLLLWFLASIFFAASVVALLPKDFHSYRFLGYPIGLMVVLSAVILKRAVIDKKKIISAVKKEKDKYLHSIVSKMYQIYLVKRYLKIASIVIISAFFIEIIVILVLPSPYFHFLAVVPIIYSLCLFIRLKAISLRINSGVFGTIEKEAKELILFIASHSDKFYFTDKDGKPKKAFLPMNLLSDPKIILNGSEVPI